MTLPAVTRDREGHCMINPIRSRSLAAQCVMQAQKDYQAALLAAIHGRPHDLAAAQVKAEKLLDQVYEYLCARG